VARPRSRTDEEILDAARACFLELGPSVSTTVIAHRLGLSGPALFHRFGSKQQLLIAAMCPDSSELPLKSLGRAVDDRPIPAQLHVIAAEITDHLKRVMPRLAVLRAAGISPLEAWKHYEAPPPLLIHRGLTDWISRALDAGRLRPCDASHTASAFMGALQSQAILHMAGRPIASPAETESYIEQLVQIFWVGLCPPSETP
jgi:AcrR family transcriptional regulator